MIDAVTRDANVRARSMGGFRFGVPDAAGSSLSVGPSGVELAGAQRAAIYLGMKPCVGRLASGVARRFIYLDR